MLRYSVANRSSATFTRYHQHIARGVHSFPRSNHIARTTHVNKPTSRLQRHDSITSQNMLYQSPIVKKSHPVTSAARQSSSAAEIQPTPAKVDYDHVEQEYVEHDADVGIPCTFIEFPGLKNAPGVTKPFSLIGFGDYIQPTYDKETLRGHLSDYLSTGGRVVRIHHGHEAAIFEELVNQTIFQQVNPDDLTLVLPISAVETLTGRPARAAPVDPIPFNDELYQQRLKERCPHFVPFRPGYAFEKVIHDLTLKIDGRNLEKELGLVTVDKYDDEASTPSFMLEKGAEPAKDTFAKICQPAGKYMGDRIADKINQVTSHLASESVDLLMLDELEQIPSHIQTEQHNFIMEAFFQFELAVMDGKARGYGVSSSYLSENWDHHKFISMYKLVVMSNFAAELARLHRGQPTKDPDFHPQQWSLCLALLNDVLLDTTTPDSRMARNYIEAGVEKLQNPSTPTPAKRRRSVEVMLRALEVREKESMAARQIRTRQDGVLLQASEYNPHMDPTETQIEALAGYGDVEEAELGINRARADLLYKKRQDLMYAAARAKAIDAAAKLASGRGGKVAKEWKIFVRGEADAVFASAMGVTVSQEYQRLASEEKAQYELEAMQLAEKHLANRELPRTALALATGICDVPGVKKQDVIYQRFIEFMMSRNRVMNDLRKSNNLDLEKLLDGRPLTKDRVYRDSNYVPRFLRNKRTSNLLALETTFNLFTPQLVRTRTYPAPSNPQELLTPHEYALAHGLLLMTRNTTNASFDTHHFRMESIDASTPEQLKQIKSEAFSASCLMRTLERAYPYMARDCGHTGLPPAYALWPATFFLMKADKMVYHSRFEEITHKELLPAALGALREIQHLPVFAEYSKQFRTALQRFTTAQFVALQQSVAPVVTVLEEFVDETCPSVRSLPTLEAKLTAVSLALQFDSVAISNYAAVRPILDQLDAEREAVRRNHDWSGSEEPEYPLLPACVPSKEEALALLDAVSAHMHAEISQRLRECVSLCVDDVLERAKAEPPAPQDIDIFVPGEKSVLDAPIVHSPTEEVKRAKTMMKFQSRHGLFLLNLD